MTEPKPPPKPKCAADLKAAQLDLEITLRRCATICVMLLSRSGSPRKYRTDKEIAERRRKIWEIIQLSYKPQEKPRCHCTKRKLSLRRPRRVKEAERKNLLARAALEKQLGLTLSADTIVSENFSVNEQRPNSTWINY